MLDVDGSRFFIASANETPSGRAEIIIVEGPTWFDARRAARAALRTTEVYVSPALSPETFPRMKIRSAARVQATWSGSGAGAKLWARCLKRPRGEGKLVPGPWEALP